MYNGSGEHDTKIIVAVGGVGVFAGVSPDLQGFPPLYSEFSVWRGELARRQEYHLHRLKIHGSQPPGVQPNQQACHFLRARDHRSPCVMNS